MPVVPSNTTRRILYISSYEPTYDNFEPNFDGICSVLYENNISVDVMCMDAKQFNSAQDILAFHDTLSQRLQEHEPYLGVIVSDDMALRFVLNYKNELFMGVPVTYFGINDESLAQRASSNSLIAGYLQDSCIAETIRLAKKLMPQATKVVAVYDDTPSGTGAVEVFQKEKVAFPDLSFSTLNLSDYSMEDIKKIVACYKDNTILMVLPCSRDKDYHYYTTSQMAAIFDEAASIPVFHTSVGGYATGYAAGVSQDFEKIAARSAELMVSALDGDTIYSELNEPLDTMDCTETIYNYRQAREFGFDSAIFPEDAQVIDAPSGFFATYQPVLVPGVFILAGISILLFYFYVQNVLRARREKQLQISNEQLTRSRQEIQWNAEHDYLTGLLNWRTSIGKLGDLTKETDPHYAVILMDIDNFKEVNDAFGHESGDDVLKIMASRLQEVCCRQESYLSRYGGDEFLVLVPGRYLKEDAAEVRELMQTFREPILIGEEKISPASSVGVANSEGSRRPEDVILLADIALTKAKEAGKDIAVFYTQDMKDQVNEELRVKGLIVDAYKNGGFSMVYQPQVSARTGETLGYESLVRMPGAGISPGVFIPVAERSGQIRYIGRRTTELVISQIAKWQKEGAKVHPVSINFSFAQLGDSRYVQYLCDLLMKYHVDPHLIKMEITERFFLQNLDAAKIMLKSMQNLGIRIHLDDFGTGYSSLSLLKTLPVSCVKLDKSFVDNYLVDGDDSFVRDIIQMAHDVGKNVIVEGVETKEQFLRLQSFGVDAIQGYYFSKPLQPEDVPGFHAVL